MLLKIVARSALLAAVAAGTFSMPAGAQTAPVPPPTPAPSAGVQTGPAAWQKLIGNTIVVEGRAANYTEFFTTDGAVKHLDRDGKATGKWTLQAEKICFDYPDEDDKSCVNVEVEGSKGAFVDEDGARDVFDILPGNAKGL